MDTLFLIGICLISAIAIVLLLLNYSAEEWGDDE